MKSIVATYPESFEDLMYIMEEEQMKIITTGTKIKTIDAFIPEIGIVVEIEDNAMFNEYMYLVKLDSGHEVLLRLHQFMII